MKQEVSNESREIFKRVGMALIIFGAIDIAVMVYCIAHRINYSSSFNVFAVLAGVYVWKGHPWWVKWVTRVAAFFVAAFCAIALISPFIFPVDLAPIELHLHPIETLATAIGAIGTIVFLIVRPAGRTLLEVRVLYTPGKGEC